MFRKLLIANRGEIAVRIARTCREIGVAPVGVYSDVDRHAAFVDWLDEAYALDGSIPSESYLSVEKLVEVALRSRCEAVHPGYGFLAENPRFAEACAAAGLVFVGPPIEAMATMGDKLAARRVAERVGVPVVPGGGPVSDPAAARRFASEHGFPLVIKAVAGGGGRGMRVVHSVAELDAALEAARREGQAYFADPRVYIERRIEDPRHVEVQLLGLCSGEVVPLGERDCSVQRRYQKLIEESPAPCVDADLRAGMETAAVRLAEAVGYKGVGTVEMLLDREGRYYFLEMNTRIQVEHPVTEMVRGIDLVAMQLLVAAGEQVDGFGSPRGHAIECRINAEDPREYFRPAAGRITELGEPSGPGVRVDSGVRTGATVPAEYDSLLAKLVVWGQDREEARRRSLRALPEYRVAGVPTTIPAHEWILGHPTFVAGEAGTAFLERELDALRQAMPPVQAQAPTGGGPPRQDVVVEVNARRFAVSVYGLGERPRQPKPRLAMHGATGRGGGDAVVSPLQGNVLRVAVSEGQRVSKGDLVCVIEAMKMENEIPAHKDGVIARLHVAPGDAVAAGKPVAEIRE